MTPTMRRIGMVGLVSVLAVLIAGCAQAAATLAPALDSVPSPAESVATTPAPVPTAAPLPTATSTRVPWATQVPKDIAIPVPMTPTPVPVPTTIPVPTVKPTAVPTVISVPTATPTTVPAPTSDPTTDEDEAIPPPDGLVHWWPGDGHAGDMILRNHGALQSGATFAPGKVGQAFSFDGKAFVEIANAITLEPSTITAEAWVKKLVTPGSLRYVLSKGANACFIASYAIYTGPTGGLSFYISDGLNFTASPDAGTGVWDGSWHHVVGTFDGSTVRLYVDGVEVGTGNPTTLSIGYGLSTNDEFYIGDYRGTCDSPFTGAIDEVSIYNRALSASEIRAVFNAGSGGKIKPQIRLIPTPTPRPVNTSTPGKTGTPGNTGTPTPVLTPTPRPPTKYELEVRARAGDLVGADLRGVDLSGADLRSADFYNANLSGASLSGANLLEAILHRADLTGADLTGANLRFADLTGANLTNANLTGANLTQAVLRLTILNGANLSEAILLFAKLYTTLLAGTDFDKTDWNNAYCRDPANILNFCTLEELKAAGASVAVAPPSARFSGTALIRHVPARDGIIVTATIGGAKVASTKVTTDGSYTLKIYQPANQSYGGREIIFIVGGFTAEATATWEDGEDSYLNLFATRQ